MATLYIDQTNMEIKSDGAALKLYHQGACQRSLPIKLMERLVIQGDVTLNARTLTAIMENGASVVFLSKRSSRRVATVLGGYHRDARIRLAQYDLLNNKHHVISHATALIKAKIRGQIRFLTLMLGRRPALRKPLHNALTIMYARLDSLGATSTLQGIRGVEGAASAAFFKAYIRLFPQSLGFHGRNRRPPKDPVNATLSLTYTLLHHEAVIACHGAGLDPYVGYLHQPSHGRESLACDLLEPLRPLAEAWVLSQFQERVVRPDHFNKDKGACLMSKSGRARFYPAYERFAHGQRRRLRRITQLLVRGIRHSTRGGFQSHERDQNTLSQW